MLEEDPELQESAADDPDEHDDEDSSSLREVIVTVAVALGLAVLVQAYLVKPFRIPSASMENTLRCGDRVLVDRITYRMSSPKRGDVVVFYPPVERKADGKVQRVTRGEQAYIKRVIGVPGDKVQLTRQKATVNGKKQREPYVYLTDPDQISSSGEFGPVTVPKGTYLMLGDHRDESSDGRVFRFVPDDFLVGKARMVYWPPQRMGGIPDTDPGGRTPGKADPKCNQVGGVFGA